MYSLYWLGYILLFSVIQSIPTGDFITVLRNECYSLLPKIIFVTIVVELMMPRLLFKKKICRLCFCLHWNDFVFCFCAADYR